MNVVILTKWKTQPVKHTSMVRTPAYARNVMLLIGKESMEFIAPSQ